MSFEILPEEGNSIRIYGHPLTRFDEQNQQPHLLLCHHEVRPNLDENRLIYWFDVGSRDKTKKLVSYKSGAIHQ